MALSYSEKTGCCDSEYASKLIKGVVEATLDEINVLRSDAALATITLSTFEDAIDAKLPV